jgi:fumarate hydratase class I
MKQLTYPFDEKTIRALNVGEVVSISGKIYTGRDRLHKHLAETHASPVVLKDAAIFHCGPVVVKDDNGKWSVVAAGPTTSIREEPYSPTVIKEQGIRVIIGKGGLGAGTLAACNEFGCVYLQAVGGAAAVIAESIKEVKAVYFLDEFGATEAMWELEVEDLQATVAMDSHGESLFANVKAASLEQLKQLCMA